MRTGLAIGRPQWLHVFMHTTTNAVVGYARVSTTEQAETGISLDPQRHRLRLRTRLQMPFLFP